MTNKGPNGYPKKVTPYRRAGTALCDKLTLNGEFATLAILSSRTGRLANLRSSRHRDGVLEGPHGSRDEYLGSEWALIASVLVIPHALIAGSFREIPMFHRVIDCMFGIIAAPILLTIKRLITRSERGIR